jgi:NAD(P)H dehydrogenase (quinone)
MEKTMYAITGITGKVGGELARVLLENGLPVRAVLRDVGKADAWAARGCDIAIAAMNDAAALTKAFQDTDAVFNLMPPVFDPEPGYPEARAVIDSVVTALMTAKPLKVVSLSTIGADAGQDNLLSQHTMAEAALRAMPIPVTFLRAAWFLDNASWDVASSGETGVMHSFLQPLDKAIPMVASQDVGGVAAELIQESWTGHRIVELSGPEPLSPDDLAAIFAEALGKPVRAEPVARETWETLFLSQGMRNPGPRMRMLDGFNQGWISFRNGEHQAVKGRTTAAEVIARLIAAAGKS